MFLLANGQQFKLGIAITAVSVTERGISLSRYWQYIQVVEVPSGEN